MIEILLAILGLAMGSFALALAWRLHEGKNFVTGRSQCEHCGHMLGVWDLLPLVSWLALKGKCRYCNKSISWLHPAMEVTAGALFLLSYLFWPYDLTSWQAITSFIIWLIYTVLLLAMLAYDLRWMLLPNVLVFPLIGLALIDAGLRVSLLGDVTFINYLLHVVMGAGALGGFYWLLYGVSGGRWVGFGDVKLGIFMGIVLGWQQAFMVLFLANLIGLVAVLPSLLMGKLSIKARLPFGPFLIAAFFIVGLFGAELIRWYISFFLLS
jgi:prepilin signal peptidase PulO-like enzyme (type II secretory pathway)